MEISLRVANIVILANTHNPSIISKEWLKEREVIEEAVVNFTHTPVFSIVETNNFLFIVNPDRLEISIKSTTTENMENLPRIVKKYINRLPETPYTAIGFNYIYHVKSGKGLENIFSIDNKKFIELFSENYQIGGIVIFKFKDFTIRLNLEPLPANMEKIEAKFNFHFDSKELNTIENKVELYNEMKEKAEKILGGLFGV